MTKVLLVDDDEELTTLLQEYLSEDGYDVATTSDGRAAITAAVAGSVDLIIHKNTDGTASPDRGSVRGGEPEVVENVGDPRVGGGFQKEFLIVGLGIVESDLHHWKALNSRRAGASASESRRRGVAFTYSHPSERRVKYSS